MKKSAFILFALALLLCLCPAFASSNEDESARPVDNNPPKVKGITLNTTSVTAPDTITVTVKATDDVSGVGDGSVWFRNVKTDSSLSAYLEPYSDGKLIGEIEIGPYTKAGTYIIEELCLADNADNDVYYYGKGSEDYPEKQNKLPDALAGLSFTVKNGGVMDDDPPKVTGITINATTVTAPGTITVTATATDDVSGVGYGIIWFRDAKTDSSLSASLVVNGDGKLNGTIEIGSYTKAGTYIIEELCLADNADNDVYYYGKGSEDYPEKQNKLPDALAGLSFTVKNGGVMDNEPPKVTGITLNATSVTAPGTITVTVTATDDVSGMAYGMVSFCNAETDSSLGAISTFNDGKLIGEIEIGPYTKAGTYIIEGLLLADNAENYVCYYGKGSEYYSCFEEVYKLPDALAGLSFTVVQDSSSTSITIKTQPKDAKVKSGSKAKFTVKVKEKDVTYQWYSLVPGAEDWTAMAGETKATLNVVGSKANNGTMYRCRIRNKEGREVYSNVAFLTVTLQKPVIKTPPKSLAVVSGKKAKFTVKASGPKLTYTWYSRPNAEAAWTPVAGQTKSSLSVVASKANDGSQYYCHIQNADGEVDSAVVTLTVTPEAPTIKTQPKDAKVKIGAKAKFKVKASGKNVTYQWYYRTSETGEWVLMEGETSANLTVVATEGNIGWQFRCLAKNADGQVYSKPATLLKK